MVLWYIVIIITTVVGLPIALPNLLPMPISPIDYARIYLTSLCIAALAISTILALKWDKDRKLFILCILLTILFNLAAIQLSYRSLETTDYGEGLKEVLKGIPEIASVIFVLSYFPLLTFGCWRIGMEIAFIRLRDVVISVAVAIFLTFVFSISILHSFEPSFMEFFGLTSLMGIVLVFIFTLLVRIYREVEAKAYYYVALFFFLLNFISSTMIAAGITTFAIPLVFYAMSLAAVLGGLVYLYSMDMPIPSYQEVVEEKDRLAELYKKVNEMREVLSIINKMVRHDVKNKLQIIMGYIEVYLQEKDENYLQKAIRAVEETNEYLNKIRDLEMAISVDKSLLKPTNIREVVEDVMKFYNIEYKIHGNCFALADDAIYSVIDNIVNNAIKHGKTERIDFMLSEINGECEIRIIDYGIGIPSELKRKIFEPGFTLDPATGSGLGLYVVRKVVERYGGRVWVEDTKPKGATFVIRLKSKQAASD
jgi:signal transduction histidine kinase